MKNHRINMKATLRGLVSLLLLGCMLLGAALPLFAAYPKSDDGIADEAGVLSEATIRTIKQENQSLSKDLGVSIAVCTVKTTGETSIEEYAHGLFKNWKLGEGVLLLIATEDKDYYFVPSAGTESVLTAQVLTAVRDGYLEADFASGNIDRGVLKTASRLSALLVSGMEQLKQEQKEDKQETENEGTSVGAFIVGFFKLLLWIVLILGVAFVVFFVVAMFNEDAAAILRKYVFKKNKQRVAPYAYDERLYGTPKRRSNSQDGRRPAGQAPRQQSRANPYPAQNRQTRNIQRSNPANQNRPTYYNADGTPRRQNAPQGQRAPRRDDKFGDETRQFTIPTRYDR